MHRTASDVKNNKAHITIKFLETSGVLGLKMLRHKEDPTCWVDYLDCILVGAHSYGLEVMEDSESRSAGFLPRVYPWHVIEFFEWRGDVEPKERD